MWAPALYTYLAMSWGAEGWLVIAGVIVVATVAMGPSVRLAQGFRSRNFPELEDDASSLAPEPAT
jgi:hypothetical protein